MPALSEVLTLPPLRWILALVKLSIIAVFIWFLIHTGFLLWDGLTDELDNENLKANIAVVLGDEILPNGKPAPSLKAKLDQTVELFRKARIESVIVSSKVDDAGHDAATIMGRYLYRQGIPKEAISIDSLGENLYLTAADVKHMMEYHKTRKIIVVITSFPQIMRAKLALNKCGFRVVYGAHSPYFEWQDLWLSIPKEFLAYYFYLNRSCPDPTSF